MCSSDLAPTIELVVPFDAAYEQAFGSGTTFSLMSVTSVGGNTSQRWCGWQASNLSFAAAPTREDMGGLVYMHLKFRCLADTVCAGSPLGASSTDLARSPLRFFWA